MQECFPKHSCIDSKNEIRQRNRKRRLEEDMEKSKAATKEKRSPDGLNYPNQNTINKPNLLVFYKRWKKYHEIHLRKNKMNLNNRKMTHHPASRILK